MCDSFDTKEGPNNNRHMEKTNGLINLFSTGDSIFMNSKCWEKCGSYYTTFLPFLKNQGSVNI